MYDYCRIVIKNPRRRKKKLPIILAVFFLAAILSMSHYFFFALPIIRRISEEEARILATSSVGKAAAQTVTDNYSYRDIIEVTKDAEGNIVLLQANSTFIHVLIRTAATRAQTYIGEVQEMTIRIPFGTLSGVTFLSGRGPNISIKAIPIGIISTEVGSEFIAVGINQTLHRIFVKIRADVTIIMPGYEGRVSSSVHIPIAESVLVGKVPSFYLSSPLFENMLNPSQQ